MKKEHAKNLSAFLLLMACIASTSSLTAQTNEILKFKNDTAVIVNLQRQQGFGPAGNLSYGMSAIAFTNRETPGLIPETFKRTTELTDVEYFYEIYDTPQFYYQSFIRKIVSLTQLEDKLQQSRLSLKDTSQLSGKPIKCGFYVAVGKDQSGQLKVIVDKNNNADLSDDPIFVLPKSLMPNLKVTSQISADMEFIGLDQKKYVHNVICAFTGAQTATAIDLMISYPQFNIARVKFESQNYIICTSYGPLTSKLYILPDIPYFVSVGKGSAAPKDLVKIGSADLRFQRVSNNGQQILLTGRSVSGLSIQSP